jgi:CelD/BcsL family acetyltransferase involved in cellulose biosynthesis
VPIEIIRGIPAVAAELDRCRDLMSELDAPVTARTTWLDAALRCLRVGQPWAVVSRSETGAPNGAAFLTVSRSRGYADVALLGAGVSDYARLLAADPAVAREVAEGIISVLCDIRGPWRLHIEQVPPGDPVLAYLAVSLRHSVLVDGDISPITHFGPDRLLANHLSKNGRGTSKQGRNRLTREDPGWRIDRTRDSAVIEELLPTLVELHRLRDQAAGRRRHLDDPRQTEFFTTVIRALAEEGGVEVATLLVKDVVAAYFVVLLDGSVWRFWNGRINMAHSRLRVGRVLDVALLSAALEDPSVSAADWMRGDLEHKWQSANDALRTEMLTAWSSAALRSAERSARWGREQFRVVARIGSGARRSFRRPGKAPEPVTAPTA